MTLEEKTEGGSPVVVGGGGSPYLSRLVLGELGVKKRKARKEERWAPTVGAYRAGPPNARASFGREFLTKGDGEGKEPLSRHERGFCFPREKG